MAVATARETILLLLVTLVSSAAVIDARPSRQRSSTLDWGGNSRGGLAMPSIPTDAHYSATSWAGPDSEPGIAIRYCTAALKFSYMDRNFYFLFF